MTWVREMKNVFNKIILCVIEDHLEMAEFSFIWIRLTVDTGWPL